MYFFMDNYCWNEEKNQWLQQERGISFEEVVAAVQNGNVIDDIENPNEAKCPNQFTLIVQIRGYIYCVPYVMDNSIIFFKTIFPSRKMKKEYLGG